MARNLTPKQERFVAEYLTTGNATEAYRVAYNAHTAAQKTASAEGKRLLLNPRIAPKVSEFRQSIAKEAEITVLDLIRELEEARALAMGQARPQTNAAVAATMGKAKLLGMDKQILELTGKGGGPIQTQNFEHLTPAELEAIKSKLYGK